MSAFGSRKEILFVQLLIGAACYQTAHIPELPVYVHVYVCLFVYLTVCLLVYVCV